MRDNTRDSQPPMMVLEGVSETTSETPRRKRNGPDGESGPFKEGRTLASFQTGPCDGYPDLARPLLTLGSPLGTIRPTPEVESRKRAMRRAERPEPGRARR